MIHPLASSRQATRSLIVFGFAAALQLAVANPGAGHSATPKKKPKIDRPTLYVVGYSHLDTQWCWSYPQVIREFIPNTLHENFALFEKYPDYVFNWTGSNRYRFMKEYYPEDYAKLKKYVAAGRWFPAGSSIEEGDVNSPSSESLIRQVLYGNEFFRTEFGIASDEYMLPDCFGFPASLPSILAHCGIKGFSTQKLTWGSAVGIPFEVGNWIGPDGRSVVAALDATSYTSSIDDDLSHDRAWIKRLDDKDIARDGVPADYRYYGVGDRGGAPDERSVQNLEKSLHGDGPLKIVGGRADQMFNDLSASQIASLASYQGDLELTQHSAGSPTSEAAMKRWNRKNELLGDDTERASVAADWLGALPYDKSRITDAWLRFLPGQFHDLMAGTALPVAYNYTWNDEILAMNEFAGVLQAGVGGVARALDTRAKGVPIVVYNPLSIGRQDIVEATVDFPRGAPVGVQVFGPDGREAPSQIVGRQAKSVKVLFLASVPSVGFATFDVRPAARATPVSMLKVTADSVENSRYRVRLNSDGDVASIVDKAAGKELLAHPARLVYMYENPSQYPAWNMDWSDQSQPPRSAVTGPAVVKIVENGPARVALQVTREHDGSKFVQTVSLAAGSAGNRVEFATQIDWQGKETALMAEFPLTVSSPQATYNWGIGTIQRGNDDPKKYEVVSHGWFDLTNPSKDYGVSVLDDCKYGSDKPSDDTLRLTLLYTPGTRGGYQHQGTQDWGHHEMVYALEGHTGAGLVGTQWESMRVNQPLLAFQTAPHDGPQGKSFSFVRVDSSHVAVEALKQAESGDATVIRLNELAGEPARDVHVRFPAPVVSAEELDGQERPIGPAHVVEGQLVMSTTAYRPHTYAVHLAGRVHLEAASGQPLSLPYNQDGVSSWANKTDGDFDGAGKTLPGELLPHEIVSDGVTFRLGPTKAGAKNVVVAQGQTLAMPSGSHRRLYLLAASVDGDRPAKFGVGGRAVTLPIQAWDGFIGQWDNRLWEGVVPELTYDWSNPLAGLVPGFIKRAPVAWYADHRRLADGSNDIYKFCYLYRYAIDLPDGLKSVTLPNDPTIRIMAATVARDFNDDTRPAQPLYDVIDGRENSAPGITVHPLGTPGQSGSHGSVFSDTVQVDFSRPEYWTASQSLRYTLDGSNPGPDSPVCGRSIFLSRSATIKVAEWDGARRVSPIGTSIVSVNDVTPPAIKSVISVPFDPAIRVRFSEPLDRTSAETLANYALSSGVAIKSAALSDDGQTVTLTLDAPLLANVDNTLTVNGVKDLSPAANVLSGGRASVERLAPVFSLADVQAFVGRQGVTRRDVPNLPTHAGDPWTMNVFVYADKQPDDLTIISGFGDGRDTGGAERFLVSHEGGIEFWGSNVDIGDGQPLALGRWQMLTVTFDGHDIRLFRDGHELKSAPATLSDAAPIVRLAPAPAWQNGHRFTGKIAGLTIWNQVLPPQAIQALTASRPPSP